MVPLTIQEASYFSLFFDSVAESVSSRLGDTSRVGEEHLTFLLCEMMDDNYNSRHVLKYTLADLKSDLERIGSLLTVGIDTIAHEKPLENMYSASDLGIVIRYTDEYDKPIEKAVLVQAKRLDKSVGASEYTYRSSYSKFDPDQITVLKSINDTYGPKSTCYLFYNPPRAAFKESSQRQITQSEQTIEEMDKSFISIPHSISHSISHTSALSAFLQFGILKLLNGWIRSYLPASILLGRPLTERLGASPGLRFSDTQTVDDVRNASGRIVPSLYDMYSKVRDSSNQNMVGFSPLSTFFIGGLFLCQFGELKPGLIKLAKGQVDNVTSPGDVRQMGVAKYTIVIHVRTLSLRSQGDEE